MQQLLLYNTSCQLTVKLHHMVDVASFYMCGSCREVVGGEGQGGALTMLKDSMDHQATT